MKYFKTHTQFLNEVRRSKEPFTFSEKEIKDIADLIAKAISKVDKTKAAVHDMEFVDGEGAGFEISIDGEKYDGGSYDVRPNGEVVNVAIGNSFPNAVYAKIGDKNINQIIKNIKKFESVDVNEAKLSAIHKAAKKGSYPVSIVVIKDGKVIAQELVKTPAAVPAAFNVIKNYHKHKGATVHVESKTGERLFSESVVTEGDTISGLNNMANTNLERIADYANMIKDRMSQGQQLDAWMYSKISDSVKNLNSVHDTMDGNDGVVEATDVNEATDFNDPVLIRIRQVRKHANDMKKLDAMKKEAEREAKRNRPRWTQKKYDKWLDTVASNGGAENAFDMAKNAEFEPGLIDWVKKEFRGDDPLQRIQWDIEAFAK